MGKVISSGLILTDGEIFLGCHVTGHYQYDIPKGLVDVNELPLETCIREMKEETDIDVSFENLVDLGIFNYTKKKNLHLFLLVKKNLPDIGLMSCSTFFEEKYTKKMKPEVDGYKYISFGQRCFFMTPNMNEVLDKVEKIVKESNKSSLS